MKDFFASNVIQLAEDGMVLGKYVKLTHASIHY